MGIIHHIKSPLRRKKEVASFEAVVGAEKRFSDFIQSLEDVAVFDSYEGMSLLEDALQAHATMADVFNIEPSTEHLEQFYLHIDTPQITPLRLVSV